MKWQTDAVRHNSIVCNQFSEAVIRFLASSRPLVGNVQFWVHSGFPHCSSHPPTCMAHSSFGGLRVPPLIGDIQADAASFRSLRSTFGARTTPRNGRRSPLAHRQLARGLEGGKLCCWRLCLHHSGGCSPGRGLGPCQWHLFFQLCYSYKEKKHARDPCYHLFLSMTAGGACGFTKDMNEQHKGPLPLSNR